MSVDRVLINLCWLVPGVVGGSEESTTDSIRALTGAAPPQMQIELAVLPTFLGAHPDLAESLRCHVAPFGVGSKATRIFAEQTWLAALSAREQPSLVHHAGGVVPLVHPRPVVLTIHDLQPLEHPENFSRAKRTYLNAMIGRSARAARIICVPSQFTARRVEELLGIERSRIVVVPWPVAQRSAAHAVDSQGSSGAGFTPYPGWTTERRYILYPSITYPHKRHLLLLAAFAELQESHPNLDLVLTGGAAQMEDALTAETARLGLQSRVKRLGRVPFDQLEQLYAAASVVAIPSSYEGFGLPALEAMTEGVPLVAASAGSLPELLPADWTVGTDDPVAWAGAIEGVLQLDGPLLGARIDKGKEIAATFTPQRTASALLRAYRMALGSDVSTP
ncbi:MAG: glycosyltransferase family 4 protein [Microthrixaceae bacterium]|nr:glycosyltransferase family 4 protein [Microthrixaceae bacterium]